LPLETSGQTAPRQLGTLFGTPAKAPLFESPTESSATPEPPAIAEGRALAALPGNPEQQAAFEDRATAAFSVNPMDRPGVENLPTDQIGGSPSAIDRGQGMAKLAV
jgi:hypothetical protein